MRIDRNYPLSHTLRGRTGGLQDHGLHSGGVPGHSDVLRGAGQGHFQALVGQVHLMKGAL